MLRGYLQCGRTSSRWKHLEALDCNETGMSCHDMARFACAQVYLYRDLEFLESVSIQCKLCIFLSTRCRKLPRALKDWQAFQDLKQTIDDFNESCPLLELMANKAMKQRHWDRIAGLTGHTFDMESETFSLRNIMEAPLLKHKEDIEVCTQWIVSFSLLFS